MGLQHYTQNMSEIPLKYQKKMLFYTKYTHPTLICRGTHTRTDVRTHGRMENIYSILRDKLLLLGEHEYKKMFYIFVHTHYINLDYIKWVTVMLKGTPA